jgi:propionyl-CoA synthetase
VTGSCGIEPTEIVEYKPIVDRALEMAEHSPEPVVLKQRPQGGCGACGSPATSTGTWR